ncbi:MAG: hypothetical protein HZC48_13640 [Nitrospirae bacterium]|nr:hypothetical protein [Nitrospirota bacterium]
MKYKRWYISLAIALTASSTVLYLLQISIFRRAEETFFYMLQDIAFVPIQVLLVTLILNQLLSSREKRALMKKMNMLIGTFHIEAGSELIKLCSAFNSDVTEIRKRLMVTSKWTARDFQSAAAFVKSMDLRIDSRSADLNSLKTLLEVKRSFLLSLLANPNLLEHDSFTDLLWAVFHLAEELSARKTFEGLPKTDYDHLSGDIKRTYSQLLAEWLLYMKHLKADYPYLFSLAVRMNPINPDADAVVKE